MTFRTRRRWTIQLCGLHASQLREWLSRYERRRSGRMLSLQVSRCVRLRVHQHAPSQLRLLRLPSQRLWQGDSSSGSRRSRRDGRRCAALGRRLVRPATPPRRSKHTRSLAQLPRANLLFLSITASTSSRPISSGFSSSSGGSQSHRNGTGSGESFCPLFCQTNTRKVCSTLRSIHRTSSPLGRPGNFARLKALSPGR